MSLDLLADLAKLFSIEAREMKDDDLDEAERLQAIADILEDRFSRQLLQELEL
jgi:hypothetical protein